MTRRSPSPSSSSGLAYATWIQNPENVPSDPAGKCREIAERMAAEFPGLRVVYGIYKEPGGHDNWHWWCEDADGFVIDPTASQFVPGGTYQVGVIDGAEVTGLCRCGKPLFDDDEECPLGCDWQRPMEDGR